MTIYIQGGTRINGVNLPTKKALREAVKENPSRVFFYNTSPMGPQFEGRVSDVPEGTTLTVVGPDPYRARNWFASITRTAQGLKVT